MAEILLCSFVCATETSSSVENHGRLQANCSLLIMIWGTCESHTMQWSGMHPKIPQREPLICGDLLVLLPSPPLHMQRRTTWFQLRSGYWLTVCLPALLQVCLLQVGEHQAICPCHGHGEHTAVHSASCKLSLSATETGKILHDVFASPGRSKWL